MILENNIRIPQIIAVVLQGIAAIIAIGVMLIQDGLLPTALRNTGDFVIPPSFVYLILYLIIYVVFLVIIQTYRGNSRRGIGIAFIVITTILGVSNPYVTSVMNVVWSRTQGSMALAMKSQINSYMSFTTIPLTVIATALFYISCARYGVSKGIIDNVPDYQGYQNNAPNYQSYSNNVPNYQGYQNNNDQ